MATLLHDVGKPWTMVTRDGKPTFYNHEVVGARMVKVIADRLRFPGRRETFYGKWSVGYMFAYNPEMTESAIRRFMRRVGKEDIPQMIELRVGDEKAEVVKKRVGG